MLMAEIALAWSHWDIKVKICIIGKIQETKIAVMKMNLSLKSVHFKKTVAQSSFLSKVL